jgi:hypothetical protein
LLRFDIHLNLTKYKYERKSTQTFSIKSKSANNNHDDEFELPFLLSAAALFNGATAAETVELGTADYISRTDHLPPCLRLLHHRPTSPSPTSAATAITGFNLLLAVMDGLRQPQVIGGGKRPSRRSYG